MIKNYQLFGDKCQYSKEISAFCKTEFPFPNQSLQKCPSFRYNNTWSLWKHKQSGIRQHCWSDSLVSHFSSLSYSLDVLRKAFPIRPSPGSKWMPYGTLMWQRSVTAIWSTGQPSPVLSGASWSLLTAWPGDETAQRYGSVRRGRWHV